MFSHLHNNELLMLAACFCFGAGALGWLADGVVHRLGFGIVGNTALALLGAVGTVFMLERALSSHWVSIPYSLDPATFWISGAVGGGTVLLLIGMVVKSLRLR